MKVIILCEGYGSRLQSIVSDRPKPLAPIAGKPFLDYIFSWLKKYNLIDVVFCVSYKADQIIKYIGDGKKFGINPIFSQRPTPSGTGGAIKYALEYVEDTLEDVVIINGDTFFDINLNKFKEFHKQHAAFVTLALSHVLDVHRYGQVVIEHTGKLTEFKEKGLDTGQSQAGLVNGGVYMFSRAALRLIKKMPSPFSVEKDFFSVQIKKHNFFGYVSDTTHYDMGTPAGYRRTERVLSGQEEILIRSRAPLRVSFGGGGTDVPPFDKEEGGCVLSGSINRYVYGLLRLRDDRKVRLASSDYRLSVVYDDVKKIELDGHLDLIKAIIKRINVDFGFEIEIQSDVPPRSGMGSSASVCVAVIGLFNHLLVTSKMTKSQIAELAFKVETEDLKNIGGRQDQYAAVYGGLNLFEFCGDDFVKVSPITLERNILLELERNTILAYIGRREASGIIHSSDKKTYSEKKQILPIIKQLGYESYQSLIRGDMNRFGYLMEETWELKKRAFVGSTNNHINRLYNCAKEAGAIGGRITGAGGGGHMIFYCRTGTDHKVANALRAQGAKILDFSFDSAGLQTWEI